MKDICEQTMMQLSDHHDEGRPLSSELTGHLLECPDCAEFHEQWQPEGSLSTVARIEQTAEVSPELRDSIMSHVTASRPNKVKNSSILKLWIPLAAAACIALLIVLQPDNSPTPGQPAPVAQHPSPDADLEQVQLAINNLTPNQAQLTESLQFISESGAEMISKQSKQISKVASGIEYVSTNLTKIIPRLPSEPDEQSAIIHFDQRA